MSKPARELHIWAFLQGIGFYPGGWRHPLAQPRSVFDRAYYEDVARLAERGRFDAIVFGDQLQGRDAAGRTPERLAIPTLDPFTLLSAMGAVTERVGLVATVSTTYNAPMGVAERFASLDLASSGRAGWNIVTTAHPNAAPNFGERDLMEKGLRYRRAEEFVNVTTQLWDAVDDPARPIVRHKGEWFDVEGQLDTPYVPQGRPVLVQAGQSGDGRDFAARTAEAIFCPAATLEAGQAFRDDIRERVARAGRDPDGVKIMPGLAFVLADTEEAAQRKERELLEMADDGLCIEYLSESIGYDLTRHAASDLIPIDTIVAECEFPAEDIRRMLTPGVERGQTIADYCRGYARQPRGHAIFVGTAEQLADRMGHWIDEGGCDGFTLQPGFMPEELRLFVDHTVPLLQQRGLLRTDYEGTTLRNHLGLSTRR
ncbi:NtaA/DmoA family FMN-dependent monooxygenase [Sphingobium sp. CR2-8]|uniref:NtaA/DmoA family FMN-dependent monooxygenase n=1 Tax=Sphingobium sp. CR2-8 TaxID=1306534 RepID=UPI002DBAC228|nr:NtaA/DmoA family FMN-dependent monooxygenase [Sphingobium sp. CR2-8]MEC3911481.1 NtaA/DmoA family FMN-dependent monooxygenase [Sphingobium sp. CR2-8]